MQSVELIRTSCQLQGANGSPACAPDDRLRDEAIQAHAFVVCECACWINCGICLRWPPASRSVWCSSLEIERSSGCRVSPLSNGGTYLENSMTIQRFEAGPRMSQIVVHGDTIYLAGIVAKAAAGESVTKQTREILSIVDGHLTKAGSDKSKLLTATIYLTDMKTFAEMNAVWDGWVSPGNTPARATVEAGLAAPQYGVEIMVTAAR